MKITKSKLEQLVKEELESFLNEPALEEEWAPTNHRLLEADQLHGKMKKLMKEWPWILKRIEADIGGACNEGVRHRRQALLLTNAARAEGQSRLVKALRSHRRDVNTAMRASCPEA